MKKGFNLKIAAWAAIINAALVLPAFLLGILIVLFPESTLIRQISIVTALAALIPFTLVILGWLRVAKLFKQRFLEVTTLLAFLAGIAYTFFFSHIYETSLLMTILPMVILGGISIAMGIAILRLKKQFHGLALGVGIVMIIDGAVLASFWLFLFYPLTAIATNIMEAVFFFHASKKIDSLQAKLKR